MSTREGTPRRAGRRKHVPGAPAVEEQLIAAAAAAFGAQGYAAARLEDIAAAADITRPSLLHHFPSKRVLFAAALQRAFEMLTSVVHTALLVPGDYETRVRHVVGALVAFNDENRAMLAMIFRGVLREDQLVRDAVRRHFVPLVDLMVQHLRLAAGDALPRDYPLRQAVLTLVVSQLTHSCMGPFGEEVWEGGTRIDEVGAMLLGAAMNR